MALVGVALLWVALTVQLSGGAIGVEGTRLLIIDAVGAAAGRAGALESFGWTPPLWHWAIPFTAATAAYLGASALLIAAEDPFRWLVGVGFSIRVIGTLGGELNIEWISRAGEGIESGLDWVCTGETGTLREWVLLPSGERVSAWMALPTFGRWAGVTSLWIGLAALSLVAAAARHREH